MKQINYYRMKKDSIYNIHIKLNRNANSICCATHFENHHLETIKKFSRATPILIPLKELFLEGIQVYRIPVEQESLKLDVLKEFYKERIPLILIFCNSTRKVDFLQDQLRNDHFTAKSLHGELSQDERSLVLSEFRSGISRILITTSFDGIDVPHLSFVLHYDVPRNPVDFLKRSSRCGRFGRKGTVVYLETPEDRETMNEITKELNIKVSDLPKNFTF